jgi:hypothetical protein
VNFGQPQLCHEPATKSTSENRPKSFWSKTDFRRIFDIFFIEERRTFAFGQRFDDGYLCLVLGPRTVVARWGFPGFYPSHLDLNLFLLWKN